VPYENEDKQAVLNFNTYMGWFKMTIEVMKNYLRFKLSFFQPIAFNALDISESDYQRGLDFQRYFNALDINDRLQEFNKIKLALYGDYSAVASEYLKDYSDLSVVDIIIDTVCADFANVENENEETEDMFYTEEEDLIMHVYVGKSTPLMNFGDMFEVEDLIEHEDKLYYTFTNLDGLFDSDYFVDIKRTNYYDTNHPDYRASPLGMITPIYITKNEDAALIIPLEEPKPKKPKIVQKTTPAPIKEKRISSDLKTIKQFADEQKITVQAVYKRIDKFTKRGEQGITDKINGITYITPYGLTVLA
jgi:hypothetical protein